MQFPLLAACATALMWSSAWSATPSSEYGEAQLEIKFHRYENPRNILIDGYHCDSDFSGNVESACDPTFRFEFLREGGNGVPLSSFRQVDYYSNAATVTFGSFIGNSRQMSNPPQLPLMQVSKENTHGRNFLKVRVEDHDDNKDNELMDIFVYIFDATTTLRTVELVSKATGNKLFFEYKFTCKRNHYGQGCQKQCFGRNDETNGHFMCSSDGEKICLEGWMNIDKDCKVPSWCRWC